MDSYAKINLALDVIGLRADGFHQVSMIMQTISLADTVWLSKTGTADRITSNIDSIPLDEGNIALKAWLLVKERFRLPGGLKVHLEKRIPVEAGLAGGSSNAAAVLKGVNILFELGLDKRELAELGLSLGADVPFCVSGGTALAEGIGEIITPLPELPRLWLVLVNPGFGVSTREVYQLLDTITISRHPNISAIIKAVKSGDLTEITAHMGNVLEEVTLEKYPELVSIKKKMENMGLVSLMSGSGPTIFGVARTKEKADQAAAALTGRWKFVRVVHSI